MKSQRKKALVHKNNVLPVEVGSKVLDEERNTHLYTASFFGPCCTDGCQYCHPNCHEQTDSSNHF